jgi:hypothetical protein
MRQEVTDPQERLDLPIDEMPNVRVPGMGYPVALDFQQVGARVEVAYGIDDTTAIVLQLCKVHKFRVTPIEGGSAEVKFSISSSADIGDHVIGTLSVLQQREISIKLTMPDVEPAKEPDLTAEDIFGPQDPPEPTLSPEDVFVNDSQPATPAQKAADKKRPLAKKIAAAARKSKARA